MTTKYKIIFGFLLMIVFAGVIAFIGYRNLQQASDDFVEYRRLARLNVYTSDIDTNLNETVAWIFRFVDSRDQANMRSARTNLDVAREKIREALTFVVLPQRKEILNRISNGITTLKSDADRIEKNILEHYKQYQDIVVPAMQDMSDKMIGIDAQVTTAGNVAALHELSDTWSYFVVAASNMSHFSESLDPKEADKVRGAFAKMEASLKGLGDSLRTDEGKRLFKILVENVDKVRKIFEDMAVRARSIDDGLTGAVKFVDSMLKESGDLSADVDKQMLAFGAATLKNNGDARASLMTVSSVCMLLGVVLALFIVLGIVKVLREVSIFAEAVSGGDFNHRIRVTEKGEIGGMIAAIQKIPAVLDNVMHQASDLSSRILSGRFRDRLDSSALSGSFSNLAKAVNDVGDAYTGVIDSFPLPVMACDKNNNIVFMNSSGQTVIGGEHLNTRCSGHLKADVCSTKDCFGNCAVQKNAPTSGETTVFPQGKRMDIAVTALPLRNEKREAVGYIEIITDLTEIKARQNIMIEVTRKASEISDRVAAASEELSAQVEQVSRGAEMQRARVESTASAMTEMNATVLEVARSAGQASDQSNNTKAKAEDGATLVNRVVKAINQVNTVAVTLQDNMQELGKQAENIGGVMNVISDIADQTNLLALNAAIEAARAGDAGRGFAVVADEVRKLAEKTMTATQEVGHNIGSIQQSARTNIDEVGTAVRNISEATELANSSGTALQEIVSLAAANSSVVDSIATAAEEQSATSEEINRAIDEINKIVNETTDGMMQSSAAVQDLSRMAQELRRVMETLR